jgi:toxin ParE1/3/4
VSGKPIIPRTQANRDIEEAVDHYRAEADEKTALGFIESLAGAYSHIARHPATGSPRYAHELGLPGLRSWPLKRFPYLIFYVEHADHVDVWRVLRGERDIPSWMREPDTFA